MTQTDELILPDDYLLAERARDYWHEFAAGKVRRRAESSVGHSLIRQNLMVPLYTHLRGAEERVFSVDMRLRLKNARGIYFYYPDVFFTTEPLGPQSDICHVPVVAAEVVSAETQAVDFGEKLHSYCAAPSLHTYILASEDEREVVVHHRSAGGWTRCVLVGQSTLSIPELDFSISLDALYEGTKL